MNAQMNVVEARKQLEALKMEAQRQFRIADQYRADAAYADGQAYYQDIRKADEAYSKAKQLAKQAEALKAAIKEAQTPIWHQAAMDYFGHGNIS